MSKTIYPSIPDPTFGGDLTPTVLALADAVRLLTTQVSMLQLSNQQLAAEVSGLLKKVAALS